MYVVHTCQNSSNKKKFDPYRAVLLTSCFFSLLYAHDPQFEPILKVNLDLRRKFPFHLGANYPASRDISYFYPLCFVVYSRLSRETWVINLFIRIKYTLRKCRAKPIYLSCKPCITSFLRFKRASTCITIVKISVFYPTHPSLYRGGPGNKDPQNPKESCCVFNKGQKDETSLPAGKEQTNLQLQSERSIFHGESFRFFFWIRFPQTGPIFKRTYWPYKT